MNPKKWLDLQNGGKLTDTRETINGFPCRLILVNDGTNTLQEGQQEPTPGNTKDMGVFNFNNDKSNTKTLGFDTDNFPFCASFEVASNSDTSAGAFMSYKEPPMYLINHDGYWYNDSISIFRTKDIDISTFGWKVGDKITFTPKNCKRTTISASTTYIVENVKTFILPEGTTTIQFNFGNRWGTEPAFEEGDTFYLSNGSDEGTVLIQVGNKSDELTVELLDSKPFELAYIKNSFELRFPDEDDVGADYGFLDMNGDSTRGLKRVIDFVDKSSDEDFVAHFEEYFNKQYTFRYYLLVMGLGMVDNLGKNMMLDSWDMRIWYPRFYDMD